MGLSVSQWNSSYSRVLTKQSEYSGRLAIQKSQRFTWLKIEPQNIFSDCENHRNTPNTPICFPTEPSVTKIYVLASRSTQLCSRFSSAILVKPLQVFIPSILLNRKGTCQSKEGPAVDSISSGLNFNVLDGILFPVVAFFVSIFKRSLIISFLSTA